MFLIMLYCVDTLFFLDMFNFGKARNEDLKHGRAFELSKDQENIADTILKNADTTRAGDADLDNKIQRFSEKTDSAILNGNVNLLENEGITIPDVESPDEKN